MQVLTGKVAVITGAASGVGRALARRLAREDVKLVLADIEVAALDGAVRELAGGGAHAIGHPTDVARADAVEALAERAFSAFGRVDLVFNNAGVGGGGAATLWETPAKAFRWAMDVNFFGPLHGIRAFLPRMLAQGGEGLMAATSSAAGIVFPPTSPAYSASKAALIALMEVLAVQLQIAGSPVRAAILFPGPHVVDTNLFGSQRNLQAEYDDPLLRAGAGITDMQSFQALMKRLLGREVETTDPADFADEVLASILREEFYVLPLTEGAKRAVRKRCEDMLERRPPSIPDLFA